MKNDSVQNAFREGSRKPRLLPIISAKLGKPERVIILSGVPTHTQTHFFAGVSYPCLGEGSGKCPFRHAVFPPRYKAYFVSISLPRKALALLEVTSQGVSQLEALGEFHSFVGKVLKCTRIRRTNGPIVFELSDPLPTEQYRQPASIPDPKDLLPHYWGSPELLDPVILGRFADEKWFMRDRAEQQLDLELQERLLSRRASGEVSHGA